MIRSSVCVVSFLLVLSVAPGSVSGQAAVHVEPPHLEGPRTLEDQTATAVVQDYLDAWQTLAAALEQNRPELLDRDFVGSAKTKLLETIQQQAKSGIKTSYQPVSHDIQIVFYSPEGLSIELTDSIEYDQKIVAQDKALTTQRVKTRYVAVLTPSETRWRVRVLQTVPQQ